MVQMKRLGFAIDALVLGTVGYLISQHPFTQMAMEKGLVESIASLPSPVEPQDVWVHQYLGMESPAAPGAVAAQQWFNYVFGSDLGSMVASNPKYQNFYESNEWKNSLILPAKLRKLLPHGVAIWARNLLAGWALYVGLCSLWSLWIYKVKGSQYFPAGKDMPTFEDCLKQMGIGCNAMILYVLVPTWGEWFMERGLTKAYKDLDEVGGLPGYFGWFLVYLLFVEWGIYWVHRLMHDVKFLYDNLHETHHIYNNKGSLSPFAGLAFNPIDGMAQASPYFIGLFLMPVHFWTFVGCLFFTDVWTTNIHDTLTGDTEPVMGSAYHTLHHTKYINNYGQFFLLFDWLHDTMEAPEHRRIQWGWDLRTGRSGPNAVYKGEGKDE